MFQRPARNRAAREQLERALGANDVTQFPRETRALVVTSRAMRPAAYSPESRRAALRHDFMAKVHARHGGAAAPAPPREGVNDQHVTSFQDPDLGEVRMADVERIDQARAGRVVAAARASISGRRARQS